LDPNTRANIAATTPRICTENFPIESDTMKVMEMIKRLQSDLQD